MTRDGVAAIEDQLKLTEKPAGDRLWLNRLSWRLRGRGVAHVARPNAGCMACGSKDATFYGIATSPDFSPTPFPRAIARAITERALGRCNACGFFQDFHRLTPEQVGDYLAICADKDLTVSDEAFMQYPVPQDYLDNFERVYAAKRVANWRAYFERTGRSPKRVLFLRPNFCFYLSLFREMFDSACSALEISEVSRRTIEDHMPEVRFLEGNIHAHFFGPFLESGPYDAVVCFHTMLHCIDLGDCLTKLRSLLSPDGLLLLTHEVSVKPTNPFHVSCPTEPALCGVLRQHFLEVERLDDGDAERSPHIAPYTLKGDTPDFVATGPIAGTLP